MWRFRCGLPINRSSVAKLTQVFATDAVGFSSEEKEIEAPAGILEMDLLPLSGVVLHRCEERMTPRRRITQDRTGGGEAGSRDGRLKIRNGKRAPIRMNQSS